MIAWGDWAACRHAGPGIGATGDGDKISAGKRLREWVVPLIELAGVAIAAVAAGLAWQAADEAQDTAETAQSTARKLWEIEDARRDDENLEELLAANVSDFFSGDCVVKLAMYKFPVERWFNATDVDRELIQNSCERREDGVSRTFVMRDLTVIGSPTASHARALVELSFFSNGAHEEEGRAAVDVTFVLEEVPKITRITEAIITR